MLAQRDALFSPCRVSPSIDVMTSSSTSRARHLPLACISSPPPGPRDWLASQSMSIRRHYATPLLQRLRPQLSVAGLGYYPQFDASAHAALYMSSQVALELLTCQVVLRLLSHAPSTCTPATDDTQVPLLAPVSMILQLNRRACRHNMTMQSPQHAMTSGRPN